MLMEKKLIFLFILFLLYGCSTPFDPKEAIEYINSTDIYSISYDSYMVEDQKQITVSIEKHNEDLIFIYYQEKEKQHNFITYYNQDPSIPIRQCYVVEPTNVPEIERAFYLDYIDEIRKQYLNELENMHLNEDQLFQIIQYFYKLN